MVCGHCKPSFTESGIGTYVWGVWNAAVNAGNWNVGDCVEDDAGDCVQGPIPPNPCRAGVNITTTLNTGYYLLEYGAGLPQTGTVLSIAMASQCGTNDYWFADIYQTGVTPRIARITVTSACSECTTL